MSIVAYDQVQEQLDRKRTELDSVKRGIELDHQELKLRTKIRGTYPQMLQEYDERQSELESTVAHEKSLLDTLYLVRKPFKSMDEELDQQKSASVAGESDVEERNRISLQEAQDALAGFDAASHEGEDADAVRTRREELQQAMELRQQAYDAAREAREQAEAVVDKDQEPARANIQAVRSNISKHESALRKAQVELEDLGIKRSYVNDVISDNTGDDELHHVIARKQIHQRQLEEEVKQLQKQIARLKALDRVVWGVIAIIIVVVVYGLVRALAG